ncbi:MAG: hypothetical protein HY543_01300 [Deltaproteobacteria bacterium]|nr:hypothetical protein [Deltaproteobacteria bacterium]
MMRKITLPPTFYLRAQKRYGGKYIARKKGRVLAAAPNLRQLLKIMKTRKIRHEGEVSIGFVPSVKSLHVYIVY